MPIHFVKMDVEGSESAALRGMAGIVERYHPTMLVELNELALVRGGRSTPEELVQALKDFGYRIYEAGSTELFRLPQQRDRPLLTNLLCAV
jgi:hypothetical protein